MSTTPHNPKHSRRLAESFNNGMEYFATYGGCTAAGATGLAVLRVIEKEQLQQRAADTGEYLIEKLRTLQLVGDVVLWEVGGDVVLWEVGGDVVLWEVVGMVLVCGRW